MRLSSVYLAVALALSPLGRAHAAGGGAVVARLDVSGQKDRADVVIKGSFVQPTYSIRELGDGKRVIIEVPGASLDGEHLNVRGSAALIVRTTASTSAKGVRIVLALTRKATYRARTSKGRIHVHFETDTQLAREEGEARGLARVRHVSLERRDGRERVVVELDGKPRFRVVPGEVGPARLELMGVRLAGSVPREIAGDSESVVRNVLISQRGDRVRLEAARAKGASATAIREGNRIVWLFAEGVQRRPEASRTRTVAREEAVEVDGEEVAAFLSDMPMQLGAARGKRRFTGRKIDLDFKDADIHNILRLLSEVGNVNIVTADDVSGQVTIKMKSVPWDQALDVILTAKGFGMVRRGNLLRVAPLAVLEKEREMAIARQKQRIELAPLETRLIPVSYATAQALSERVKELLSERGSVSVDERTNVLLVRDVANSLDDAEELVRSLDSQTPQVLIEARIVEASTSFSNEFGIQWGGSTVFSSATGNPTGLLFPSDVAIAGGAADAQQPTSGLSPFSPTVPTPNFVVNLPAPVGTGVGGAVGMSLGSLAGNFNLALRLSAFETTGQVRIISSPRILTLDNFSATIQQGTSIPYSQVSAQGVQTAFQEATLKLEVTPHVTSDGAVSMEVSIQRDEPDFNQTSARGDPTILKRNADTSLLVQDGHTAVIGGIYSRNTGRGMEQVPFFGDIPIIGILFKKRSHRDARSELLIFLTPRIVNRAESLSR
ncbi:MAG: type IV pilus secretin PilQ [Myxococcales bacterium]|nr:type IV pilus secretin PilQ [Myxococcales bacterium]